MVANSPETSAHPELIFKSYLEKRKRKETDAQPDEAVTVEVAAENDAKAQEMVDALLDRAEQIPASEYQKILTLSDLRELIDNLTPESLAAANTSLAGKGKEASSVLGLLKVMINGRDNTTGLQNKFALNDSLRQTIIEIINTKDETARLDAMRRSGMIYFDVRGLKMVNDARNNHSDGDAFIARVASETKIVAEQIFGKILGPQAVAGIFRDGGDEFAITFHHAGHDLETIMTNEKIAEIFPETIAVTRADTGTTEELDVRNIAQQIAGLSGAEGETSTVKLIEVLSKILEVKMFDQKFVSESFPREVIEAHLKKGQPDYHNAALADFDMPILTAQGAQTNYEIFKNTKHSYHKKILSDEKINRLSAPEVVNAFMSAMRLAGDQKSYEAKNYQNRTWMESPDPFQQLLIDLVSRNEITVAYAESLRLAKNIILDIHNEKEALQAELQKLYRTAEEREHECAMVKQKLEMLYADLEKNLTELTAARHQIQAINQEKDRQLNPDLMDGGGI